MSNYKELIMPTIDSSQDNDSYNEDIIDSIDIWDISIQTNDIFDKEFVTYLNEFFEKNQINNLISYNSFSNWNDIKELMNDGHFIILKFHLNINITF